MKRTGLFVLGTDTGVGKTVVSAALVAALRARDVDAAPWKPYASGVDPERLEAGESLGEAVRVAQAADKKVELVAAGARGLCLDGEGIDRGSGGEIFQVGVDQPE